MASPTIALPATCWAIVNSLYRLRWLLCPLLAVALAAKFNRQDVSARKRRDGLSSKVHHPLFLLQEHRNRFRVEDSRKRQSSIRKFRLDIPELTTLNSYSIKPLPNFDWKSVLPIQLRPYKPKFFLNMGKSMPTHLAAPWPVKLTSYESP